MLKKKEEEKRACYASNTIQEDESLIVLLIIETTRYTRTSRGEHYQASKTRFRSNDRENLS